MSLPPLKTCKPGEPGKPGKPGKPSAGAALRHFWRHGAMASDGRFPGFPGFPGFPVIRFPRGGRNPAPARAGVGWSTRRAANVR